MDDIRSLKLRHALPSDYSRVVAVIDDWWDGRAMSPRLSHVFFSHFAPTSFVIETETELAGFLLGFLSQTRVDEAYIHFVGVHPDFRRLGLGRRLYERFFAAARQHGRAWVSSITAPCNTTSIGFHRRLGFLMEKGNGIVDGVPARLDYAGEGGHRVVFHRRVTPDMWPGSPGLDLVREAACSGEPRTIVPARAERHVAPVRVAAVEVADLTDCA